MATPVTLQDLDEDLLDLTQFSRPSSPKARMRALQKGYERAIRAVRIVKKGHFVQSSYVTIPAMVIRWPLTDPAFEHDNILRIQDIVGLGLNPGTVVAPATGFGGGGFGGGGFGGGGSYVPASNVVMLFRYGAIQSPEFEAASLCPAGQSPVTYYDLAFPDGVPTLALAPPLVMSVSVLITSKYEPEPLTAPGSILESVLWRATDLIVNFAAEIMLRAVGDADADRYGADALQLRRELIEDLTHVSEGNTVGVGTELTWDDF